MGLASWSVDYRTSMWAEPPTRSGFWGRAQFPSHYCQRACVLHDCVRYCVSRMLGTSARADGVVDLNREEASCCWHQAIRMTPWLGTPDDEHP